MADKIANRLVLGLLLSGKFSIVNVMLPNAPAASMWWVFLSVLGSATILILVFSLPIPVKDNNAATLIFLGNNTTACFALPSKLQCLNLFHLN